MDEEQGDGSGGWDSVEKALADLLQKALTKDKLLVGNEQRNALFQILESLAVSEDPTPIDEEQWIDNGSSPYEIAINTVRGEGLHGIIQFALWDTKIAENTSTKPTNEIWQVLNQCITGQGLILW